MPSGENTREALNVYGSSCVYKGSAGFLSSDRATEKENLFKKEKILKRTPSLPSLSSIRRGVCVCGMSGKRQLIGQKTRGSPKNK